MKKIIVLSFICIFLLGAVGAGVYFFFFKNNETIIVELETEAPAEPIIVVKDVSGYELIHVKASFLDPANVPVVDANNTRSHVFIQGNIVWYELCTKTKLKKMF